MKYDKISVSLPVPMIKAIKARAETTYGGNLSMFIKEACQRTLAPDAALSANERDLSVSKTVSMPTELWAKLDLLCAKQGTTRSALVQQLVTEELRAHKMLELTDEEVAVAAVRAALAAGTSLDAVMSGLSGKGGAS